MMKYSMVLYHREYKEFLEQLQELGLLDITLRKWEADENQRAMLQQMERYQGAIERLGALAKEGELPSEKPYATPSEAYEHYSQGSSQLDELTAQATALSKLIEESKPWGEFDTATLTALSSEGIALHFYSAYISEFESSVELWSEEATLEEISRDHLRVYFVAIAPSAAVLNIDAQQLKAPTLSVAQLNEQLSACQEQIAQANALLRSCIPYREGFASLRESVSSELHLSQVEQGGEREAEGTLVLLEGWAPAEKEHAVEQMLDASNAYYVKERPTPEDEVPVLLKNRWFPRLFEMIGNFYALPQYGTRDLTPLFAPFYMLFFGFCLAEAGYGLLYVVAALFMLRKSKTQPELSNVAWLVLFCGISTIVFGLLTGSFFGIQLAEIPALSSVKGYILDANNLFSLAIGIGFVQLIFGMIIRVIDRTKMFGIKYALSSIGWIVLIVAGLAALLLPDMGVTSFTMSSPAFTIIAGIALFLMLFLNTPGKNPLVNLGSGLWNTYNDVTGLLGDVLSYIRLFALCLAGGVLAQVFNELALGLSPEIPVVRQVVIVLILVIGHGINIFMSSLSSFVHPMRLTFVEFYKNAGFEAGQRAFRPFSKHKIIN